MSRLRLCLIAACVAATLASQTQPTIDTVIGGDWKATVKEAPALDLPLGPIRSVAVDSYGNVYVPDPANGVILKTDGNGIARIVAGNGDQKISGNGGPAIEAGIGAVEAVAVDSKGNLYLAADRNIRRVTPDGVIHHFAGHDTSLFTANIDSPDKLGTWVTSLAVDSAGNVFAADYTKDRVVRVDPSGRIATFAGGAQALPGSAVGEPMFVGRNPDGSLYFSCYTNANRTSTRGGRAEAGTPVTRALCDSAASYSGAGVPATAAKLNGPMGVAVDAAGNVYITDTGNERVRKVNTRGIITTIAGSGQAGLSPDGTPAIEARITHPGGIAVDSAGNVFIAQYATERVQRITPDGRVFLVAGTGIAGFSGDGGPATEARINFPSGVAVDDQGVLYLADTNNGRIRRIDGGRISTIAGNGQHRASPGGTSAAAAFLRRPAGVAFGPDGELYFSDRGNNRVLKLDASGRIRVIAGDGARAFTGDGGPATKASLSYPSGLAFDRKGNMYIADTGNWRMTARRP